MTMIALLNRLAIFRTLDRVRAEETLKLAELVASRGGQCTAEFWANEAWQWLDDNCIWTQEGYDLVDRATEELAAIIFDKHEDLHLLARRPGLVIRK